MGYLRFGTCAKSKRLNVGCTTLVESDGSLATDVTRQCCRGVPVDRKVMLIEHELRRLEMSVVGISESKWFGNAVYDVDDFLILHSG